MSKMKEYKYICCDDLANYKNWEIVQVIPGKEFESYYLFRKRVMKLRHSSKLTMVSHSSLVD